MIICKGEQRNGAQKLPDDIVYEILVRVPINSLLKWKNVGKSWNSLIKSSAFILNHLKTRSENSDRLLVSYYSFTSNEAQFKSEFLFLDFDSMKGEYTKGAAIPICDFRGALSSVCGNPYLLNLMNPIGTYNGLICLSVHRDSMLILWNPCVRKFIILPTIPGLLIRPTRPSYRIYVIDFGYDSLANDYKVVHILTEMLNQTSRCRFHVFSLLKGCWKNLNFPAGLVPLDTCMTSVVVNGALHWICGQSQNGNNKGIVTFNLSSELFGEMEMPESLTKGPGRCLCDRVKYKEWFALLSTTAGTGWFWFNTFEYDLWVMKEYAVAESWTKLLTFRIFDSFVDYPRYPVCFTKSGPVLFWTVKVILGVLEISRITPFVESLVLLDRPDALSY